MCTAAEFLGEVSHGYYTNGLAVFLAKEGHCATLFGIFYGHYVCIDSKSFRNLLINDCLNLFDFFAGHSLRMAEVKSGTSAVLIRTLLFHVVAEYLLKCSLKQVSSRVVLTGSRSGSLAYFKFGLIINLKGTGYNLTHMTDTVAGKLNGLFHLKYAGSCGNLTYIALLTAHGSIERSLCKNKGSFFAAVESFNDFFTVGHSLNRLFKFGLIISHKFAHNRSVEFFKHIGIHCFLGEVGILSCLLLLFFHGSLEAFFGYA